MSPALTRDHGGVSAEANKVSSGGECGGGCWVLTGGVSTLSWWFYVGSVSASASSGILILSVWEKITVGRAVASISPSKTSSIASSFLMCPARSYVLAGIVGDFSSNLTSS